MRYAYQDWRRQWGDSRRCGGALVWQLNDCWPCSSWAIVDYFHRPKPAYYAIKRCLEPVVVAVRREHRDWSNSHTRPRDSKYSVWVMNGGQAAVELDLELRFVSVTIGEDSMDAIVKRGIKAAPNGTTEVLEGLIATTRRTPLVLAVRIWSRGVCISRDADWPQPFKYLDMAERGISLSLQGDKLLVAAKKPVKGFVIEEQDGVSLPDNAIDIMPGDNQVVTMSGFEGDVQQLRWSCLK